MIRRTCCLSTSRTSLVTSGVVVVLLFDATAAVKELTILINDLTEENRVDTNDGSFRTGDAAVGDGVGLSLGLFKRVAGATDDTRAMGGTPDGLSERSTSRSFLRRFSEFARIR